MKTSSSLLSISAAAILLAVGPAQAVIIDNFEDGDTTLTLTGAAVGDARNVSQTGLSGVLGGDRDIAMALVDLDPADASSISITEVSGGALSVLTKNTDNVTVTVDWTGMTDFDLTQNNATGIYLSTYGKINNNVEITMTLNGVATQMLVGASGFSGDFFFPFADFIGGAGGLLEARSINSIQMVLSDGLAWDAAFDLIETRESFRPAPVPGTLALLGLGLGALGRRRFRRT